MQSNKATARAFDHTKFLDKIQKKTANWEDYRDYYEVLMHAIRERYMPKTPPDDVFKNFAFQWAMWLGWRRASFTGKSSDDTNETLCQQLFFQLDGSRARVPKGQDQAHYMIVPQFSPKWDKLSYGEERKAILYFTLRVCMIEAKEGGFGIRSTPIGKRMPPIRQYGAKDSPAIKTFLDTLSDMVVEYEKLDTALEKLKRKEDAALAQILRTEADEAAYDKIAAAFKRTQEGNGGGIPTMTFNTKT